MLASMAIAAPETHQLGPYSVSFNMNTNMKYTVNTPAPAETQFYTAYPMEIVTNNATGASIIITAYKNPTDSTLQTLANFAGLTLAARGFNVTNLANVTIDGKNGFVMAAIPYPQNTNVPPNTNLYQAQYWLDSKDCECGPVSVGSTRVDISSSYPQDVTQGILSGIHVMLGQAAAGQMPPSQ
jgi:hypothetical protein